MYIHVIQKCILKFTIPYKKFRFDIEYLLNHYQSSVQQLYGINN